MVLKFRADKLIYKHVIRLPIYGYDGTPVPPEEGSITRYFYDKTGRFIKEKYTDDNEFIIKKINYSKKLKTIITRNFQKKVTRINDSGDPNQDVFEVKYSKRKHFSSKRKATFIFDEKDSLIFETETWSYSHYKRFSKYPNFIKYYYHKKDTIESYECTMHDSAQVSNYIITYNKNGNTKLTSTKFKCGPRHVDPDTPNGPDEYFEPCYLTNKIVKIKFLNYTVTEYYQDPIDKLWFKEFQYTDNFNRPIKEVYYNADGQVIAARMYKYH